MKITQVQELLHKENLDGWLLFDFCGQNELARQCLRISSELLITRRLVYWIPKKGEPVQFLHKIEPHVLSHLPGKVETYLTWQEWESGLQKIVQGSRRIAMEYSPRGAVPYLAKVDAGTLELIRSFDVEVVSSGSFLQHYTCVLSQEQLETHLRAAAFLDETVDATWDKIRKSLQNQEPITEHGVRQFIMGRFEKYGFFSLGNPICAVNAHSADPHFEPSAQHSSPIHKGDFILIDLWCKERSSHAVYADISRVAVAAQAPTERQREIFHIVREAQKAATDYVRELWAAGKAILGSEVDRKARAVIEAAGYGPYFTHRTGHNIYTKDHGPGAHIDSLETLEQRSLIPETCFSLEPGIYLPGEFGVRLEYDVYLCPDRTILVTGGIQEEIVTLF